MKPGRILGIGAGLTWGLGLVALLVAFATHVEAGTVASRTDTLMARAADVVLTHTLSIEPASTSVVPGEVFTVDVVISDVQDLGALEYTLEFSPSVVLGARVQLGDFPSSTGRLIIELPPTGDPISNTRGTISHGFFSLDDFGTGPGGRGVVASIAFTAAGYGVSPLNLTTALATDTYGKALTPTILVDGSVNVVCTNVAAVDLTAVTTGDIYTNMVVQFSADISPDAAVKPYSYSVDFGDGTPPVEGVSSDDPLAMNHTFTETGPYSIEIAVWNCDMAEPATGTVQVVVSEYPVCMDVGGVELALLTGGDIYTNTLVQFSAGISPADASKPYAYTINYDDRTLPLDATSSDDPLNLKHTFATPGSYNVGIAVWNCDMEVGEAVEDTVAVTVATPAPAPLEFRVYLPVVMRGH